MDTNSANGKPNYCLSSFGFTLIEILVVIAILAIILTITLIAINPGRQFMLASDTRRKADLAELHKSIMQYYVDYKSFPKTSQWTTLTCTDPIPSQFAPYMSALPCDPDTKVKYYYQPLDADCQPCVESSQVCTGYRLLARLKNEEDKAISNAACNTPDGCGINNPDGQLYNYGVASGCSIVTTPIPTPIGGGSNTPTPTLTPTPTTIGAPTNTPTTTPDPSGSPTATPTSTVTVTQTPTNTPTITPTWTPVPTEIISVTPMPGFSPSALFDDARITHLSEMTLALEKYKFLIGNYPNCGSSWANASYCLSTPLINLILNATIPPDPEGGDPYIYIAYPDGFCLAAHLADANAHAGDINCPVEAPVSIYQYRVRQRGEIIYRAAPSILTESEKNQLDTQRRTDIQSFVDALEAYKRDNGYYPSCWLSPNTWAATGSGSFFCRGLLTSYGTSFNYDPGGVYSYNIIQWNPDINGHFQDYCFGATMDTGNNANCNLGCPVNNYDANYCYFVKNP
jgi:prepilin-type N-terminal cleavage/methylation domain-containing protein